MDSLLVCGLIPGRFKPDLQNEKEYSVTISKRMNASYITALFAGLLLFGAGCGDNNDSNNTANNTAANNNTAGNTATNNTSANNTAANNTAANNTAANNTSANNTAANNTSANNTTANNTSANNTANYTPVEPYDGERVMACSEASFSDCFENSDCMDSERCEDIGDGIEVPCCVPGPRGEIPVGEACGDGGEIQCQTGVCIGRNDGAELCTTGCETDADCPASVPECFDIPFAGKYCVEASQE